MAKFEFKLPDIGEGIAEAEIVAWHVKVGDEVAEDQQLADMMTDKATVEMESPVAGKVVQLAGEVGDMVPIGSVLAVIETAGAAAAEDRADESPAESKKERPLADGAVKPTRPRERKSRSLPWKKSCRSRPPRASPSKNPRCQRRRRPTSLLRPPCARAPATSASTWRR